VGEGGHWGFLSPSAVAPSGTNENQPKTNRNRPPPRSAACDGRSPDVFKSVFYLPPPRALNWMVKDAWAGPTLVLQVRSWLSGGSKVKAADLTMREGNS
jgi:hypothetical protein